MSAPQPPISGVCVVGLGARTAVGATAEATAAAVRAGFAGFADDPTWIARDGEPSVLAAVRDLPAGGAPVDRLLALAQSALREAAAPGGRITAGHVYLGLPAPRPGLPDDLGARIRTRFTDAPAPVHVIPTGHSAGLMAVEEACAAILEGRAEACLAGGVDSYVAPATLDWLENCGQLHTTDNAWGFVPGEAAGYCLLCSEALAVERNCPVLGRIVRTATATEPNRIKTESVCLGDGLTKAFRHVLSALPDGARVGRTICDQNGEPYRADEHGFALTRTGRHFNDGTDFLAPADCWGDIGAASGPLFIALASFAAKKGYAKGPFTLLWTSSEGGQRCAALFHAPVTEEEDGAWL